MQAADTTQFESGHAQRFTVRWWMGVFLAFSLLYVVTCQRGLGWQDSGLLQWRVWTGDYHGHIGLASAHPMYIAAGRVMLWLFGVDFAFGMNVFAGLGTAVALANLAGVLTLLTGRRWVGLAAASMLGVAHTVWWLSTITEAGYTWVIAGLTGELWLLLILLKRPRWWIVTILAFVSGAGLCMHNLSLLPLPVYVVTVIALVARKRLPPWCLAAAAAAYLAAAGPYIGMTVELAGREGSAGPAIRSALFGHYAEDVLNVTPAAGRFKANATLAAMNFVSFLLPLAIVGWIHLRRRLGGASAAALGAVTIIEAAFAFRYPVPDQFMFLLPTLTMIALAAGVGLHVLARASRSWRRAGIAMVIVSVVAPPLVYAAAPALVRAAGMDVKRTRKLPFRDELRYWLTPWKHNERSAEQFAEAALRQAAPNGVILADSTSDRPLLLTQQLRRLSPDVTIQFAGGPLPRYDVGGAAFRRALGARPLYVVTPKAGYAPHQLVEEAQFAAPGPKQALYKVVAWKQ